MSGEGTNALVGPLDADGAIKSRILTIRGVQVILDWDLAALYGVEAKTLNRQVKRNIERFPEDFMFQLSRSECSRWHSRCGVWRKMLYCKHGTCKDKEARADRTGS